MSASRITCFAAAIAVAATLALPMKHAAASTFFAWQVADVPWGDLLFVRNYPSPKSALQGAYPNGTVLQMTGTCTDDLDLNDIAGAPQDAQTAEVRYRWCQVWHDPSHSGAYVLGWVYGKYIQPH